MAIANVGTMGTVGASSGTSTLPLTTVTNALAVGDIGLVIVSSNNISTVDGQSNDITGVTDNVGNSYTKLGEYTNTVGGAAGDGATVALFFTKALVALPTGSTVTVQWSSGPGDRVMTMQKMTVGSGKSLQASTAIVVNGVDGSNGFGSVSFSGLSSLQRLYIRALAKEANTTTQITPSTNFTAITNQRSRNNASAMYVSGEFRINTSTGETSNPTLAVSGDTAAVFVALEEVDVTGYGMLLSYARKSLVFCNDGEL